MRNEAQVATLEGIHAAVRHAVGPVSKKDRKELTLRQWLRLGGYRHETPLRPLSDRQVSSLAYVDRQYLPIAGASGGKITVFVDPDGRLLGRRSWFVETNPDGPPGQRGSEQQCAWTLITNSPVDHVAGEKAEGGYIMSAKNATPKKTARKATAGKKKSGHVKIFGDYSYCAASRALGVAGWQTDEATWVFNNLDMLRPDGVLATGDDERHAKITPAPGSVSATLRDKRLTPAKISAVHMKRLEAHRARARKVLDAAKSEAAAKKAAPVKKGPGPKKKAKATPAPKKAAPAPKRAAAPAAKKAAPTPKKATPVPKGDATTTNTPAGDASS